MKKYIGTGVSAKIKKLKMITMFVLSCVMSFFIVECSMAMMNFKFQEKIDESFTNQLSITFNYYTESKERQNILMELSKQFKLSFYAKEYNSNAYAAYHIYDRNHHIESKKYSVGSIFNGSNAYDFKEISPSDYKISNYVLLTDENIDLLKNEISRYPDISINESQGEQHVDIEPIFPTILSLSAPYLIIVVMLYSMLDIAYFEKNQKKYAIEKIHGIREWDILKNKFLTEMCVMTFVYWTVNLFYIFVLGYNANDNSLLLKQSALMFAMVIIVYAMMSILFYVGVFMLDIKSVLSNMVNMMVYSITLILFKFAAILFLTVQLTLFASQGYQYYMQNKAIDKIAAMTESMVRIESFDANYSIPNEQWEDILLRLSKLAVKQDSLYVDAHNYIAWDDSNPYDALSHVKEAVRLNEQAVSFFGIKDVHGNPVQFDNQNRQTHPVILVPEDLKNNSDIKKMLESGINEYQIQYIQSHQKIYSFQPELAVSHEGWIENAMIVVDGNEDLYGYMIPVQGENLSEGFDELLKQNNIDALVNIIPPYQSFDYQMDILHNQFVESAFLVVLNLFLVYLVLYQSIVAYFQRNVKRIMILKVHGKGFLDRYDHYFIMDIILYLLIGILFAMFGKTSNILTLLIVYGINFSILTLILLHMENNKILMYLKGDDI